MTRPSPSPHHAPGMHFGRVPIRSSLPFWGVHIAAVAGVICSVSCRGWRWPLGSITCGCSVSPRDITLLSHRSFRTGASCSSSSPALHAERAEGSSGVPRTTAGTQHADHPRTSTRRGKGASGGRTSAGSCRQARGHRNQANPDLMSSPSSCGSTILPRGNVGSAVLLFAIGGAGPSSGLLRLARSCGTGLSPSLAVAHVRAPSLRDHRRQSQQPDPRARHHGRGWHNNHHYYSARPPGLLWWEIDLSITCSLDSVFGLVWTSCAAEARA